MRMRRLTFRCSSRSASPLAAAAERAAAARRDAAPLRRATRSRSAAGEGRRWSRRCARRPARADAAGVIDLGSPHAPSLEQLAEARPDLVVAERRLHGTQADKLGAGEAEVLLLDTASIDADASPGSCRSARASARDAGWRRASRRARERSRSCELAQPMPTLALFGAPGSFLVVTGATWIGDLIGRLGFSNVAPDAPARRALPGYVPLSRRGRWPRCGPSSCCCSRTAIRRASQAGSRGASRAARGGAAREPRSAACTCSTRRCSGRTRASASLRPRRWRAGGAGRRTSAAGPGALAALRSSRCHAGAAARRRRVAGRAAAAASALRSRRSASAAARARIPLAELRRRCCDSDRSAHRALAGAPAAHRCAARSSALRSAVAGALMQTVGAQPARGPGLLGVTAAAGLGGAARDRASGPSSRRWFRSSRSPAAHRRRRARSRLARARARAGRCAWCSAASRSRRCSSR